MQVVADSFDFDIPSDGFPFSGGFVGEETAFESYSSSPSPSYEENMSMVLETEQGFSVAMDLFGADLLSSENSMADFYQLTEQEHVNVEARGRKRKAVTENTKSSRVKIDARQSDSSSLESKSTRLRNRSYIEDLERKVKELTQENNKVKESLSSINAENRDLKSRVQYLEQISSKNADVSRVITSGATILNRLAKQHQQEGSNKKTAGVILVVMLLSLGMILNNDKSKSKALPITIENMDVKLDHQLSPVSQKKAKAFSAKSSAISPDHSVYSEMNRPSITKWKPNTTYLLCPRVEKLNPPEIKGAAAHVEGPMQISLLIPPDSFGMDKTSQKQFLEVTCNVVGVSTHASS